MRLLCVFFFFGYLLSTSHAQLEDLGYESGSGAVNPVTEDHQEHIYLGDSGSGDYTEITDKPSQSALPSGPTADLPPAPSRGITVNIQDTMGELGLQEKNDLGSTDIGGMTNQSTPVINQDFLAQEGLLGVLILNSPELLKERERLLKIFLGSKNLPNDTDDLLEIAGPLALEGLLCKGPLGGLCGHGSLIGMNDVLKNMSSGKPNTWLSITGFNIVRVSAWFFVSSDNQLQFQTKLSVSFPGVLRFLSSSIVDVNITAPFELQQPKPGQVLFVLKDCQPIFTRIHVRLGVLSRGIQSMLRWSLNISLPDILCPVVRFWFHIINQQLAILMDTYSLELFENDNSTASSGTLPPEQHYSLDFKDKNFPASFISWLIKRPSV